MFHNKMCARQGYDVEPKSWINQQQETSDGNVKKWARAGQPSKVWRDKDESNDQFNESIFGF